MNDSVAGRVLDDVTSCVDCALKEVLGGVGHNEVVILISGSQDQMRNYARVLKQVRENKIPIFVVTYPATIHPSYIQLAAHGAVYSVVENSPALHPLTHLQEILAHVVARVEGDTVEKLHETHYNSLAFAGTFNYNREDPTDLIITLNVPDEEKVEFFEVKDPSGKKRIFSKFEDGMVYFKFSGHLPSGIWSYHAKLYHDSVFPDTKMSVDVVTKSDSDTGLSVEIFTSDVTSVDRPVRLFAQVTRAGLPVLSALVTAELYMPGDLVDGAMYSLDLHDNGLGYPDITAGDGLYSGYVPGYGLVPGFYSVRVVVTDNNGAAVQPKGQNKGEQIA